MRRAILLRSVQRALGADVPVHDAAYLWARHRLVVPFSAVVFGAVVLLAPIAGIEDWPTRAVIGAGAVAVAVMATTEYRVLAQLDGGLVLFNASRVRQVATEVRERLGNAAELTPVGGTILLTDWQVGKHRYTAPRSSERAMQRMAAARASGSGGSS